MSRLDSPRHWEQVLQDEYADESDRACVILAGVLLDEALAVLLKVSLIPNPSGEDTLFSGAYAPLSTFSARIDMAHRLGLIDSNFARSLHLVRKIRNEFAHNVTGCDFKDGAVLNRLAELGRAISVDTVGKESRDFFPDGPRGDFQLAVSRMQWVLRVHAEHIAPIEGPALGVWSKTPDSE